MHFVEHIKGNKPIKQSVSEHLYVPLTVSLHAYFLYLSDSEFVYSRKKMDKGKSFIL